MDNLAWMKAKTIEVLVLEHGHDLKELINRELETLKKDGMMSLDAVQSAKLQLEIAQNKFNWATGEDVEVAALQLTAAEASYNRAIRLAKEEGVRLEQSNFNWPTC